MEVVLNRTSNFPIRRLKFSLYVNGELVDYMKPHESIKKFNTEDGELQVKTRFWSSNLLQINSKDEKAVQINISSQLSNFIYHFAYFLLIFSGLLLTAYSFNILNIKQYYYIFFGFLPMFYIIYWQYYRRGSYIKIIKLDRE